MVKSALIWAALALTITSSSGAGTAFTAINDSEAMRKAYSSCMKDYANAQLDAKMAASEFRRAAKTACASERDAFVAATIKDEMGFGSSEAEARTYATEEADGVVASFAGNYDAFSASNTRFAD